MDPDQFVSEVRPLLEAKDIQRLVWMLSQRWSHEDLTHLLQSGHLDARKVALLALGLVGDRGCTDMLAGQLQDPDPVVNEMAEHALWSIWFRSGSPSAVHDLGRGAQALNRREARHAIEHFDKAIAADPACVEAYNQRALAWYMLEDYEKSMEDCRRTIERMPCHFGAWAGMGHCYVQLCVWPEAIRSYRRALEINPHMQSIKDVIEELQRLGGEEFASAGDPGL